MNVVVDTEKLEWGLEKGIGNTDTYFSRMSPEIRLRHTACGLVSAAINSYALNEGIASRLVITSPHLSFDPDMQHVVALIESDGQNPTIIDASVSQFLGYAGITTAYEEYVGEQLFPPEKILSFSLQDTSVAVKWLSRAVKTFRKKYPVVDLNDARIPREALISRGPLTDAPLKDVKSAYAAIYTPTNFHTWMPPQHVRTEGDRASVFIPSGAIQIQ